MIFKLIYINSSDIGFVDLGRKRNKYRFISIIRFWNFKWKCKFYKSDSSEINENNNNLFFKYIEFEDQYLDSVSGKKLPKSLE